MSSTKKTKTETTPWAPATPYITGAMGNAQTAYNTANDNLAQFSPAMKSALDKIAANVNTPPQYSTDARTQLDKTINGDFIGSNPYTGGIADLIAKNTMGQYNTTFGAAGRAHGGLSALLAGQGVGDALQNFYSGVYENERNRQQQAIMAAPSFNADEYTAPNALIQGVTSYAGMPMNLASMYGNAITNLSSPYNVQNTTQKTSGLGSILGGALMLGSSLVPGLSSAFGGGSSGLMSSNH